MDQSNSYFTMSDLAKELDVKKDHIRFCEENGLIPPRPSKLKRRVYNRYDRERLKLVFHFVLLGYSKEQIIDLIGMPDANLDENNQLIQGIEYGLKKLKKLEKRKEELSFTRQTRIINEIEMLREYINKIKIIKSGDVEEPSAERGNRFEEKLKISTKPVRAITAKAEKKTTQHPVKIISIFAVGLVLVILTGSYFYYQAGQKETKAIKRVLEKPIHSEKILVPQAPVPMDQVAKTQAEVQETQKLAQSSSDIQQDSLKATPNTSSLDSTQKLEIPPVAGDAPVLPEKEKPGSLRVEEAPKDVIQEKVAGENLSEKEGPAAEGESIVADLVPESAKETESDIDLKEASESIVPAPLVLDDAPVLSAEEKPGSPKEEEGLRDAVQEEVAGESLSEKTARAAEGEDTLTVAVAEPEVEKVAETEVKTSSVESQKEKEQITSEENITQQQNELSRLKSFLDEYCQAYTNKNLDKFITFFAQDATENNTPFHELVPAYRKNMEGMESLTYRIELLSFSRQTASKNLMIRGKFFTRYESPKGVWEENSGSIFMELLENKDSYLIKQLNH